MSDDAVPTAKVPDDVPAGVPGEGDPDGVRKVVMLSLHTSPLKQPGSGDAGGLNVYVLELARQLASRGIRVDIFTLDELDGAADDAETADTGRSVDVEPGLTVHRLAGAGPGRITADNFDPDDVAARLAREPAVQGACVVHSHYWLSGIVALRLKRLLGVPVVHTMHTMAKVKYRDFEHAREHPDRIAAETALAHGSCLIANTEREARDLVDLYGARPDRVEVVHPGVNHAVFTPGDRDTARGRLGIDGRGGRDLMVLVVGRIQRLKGADVVIDALAELTGRAPELAGRVTAVLLGGDSGPRGHGIDALTQRASDRGVSESVTFAAPVRPATLVDWYRAADVVAVPSRSESFGLVAAEAGASGTPVIAAHIGGLNELVDDGQTGILVDGHDPADWSAAFERLLGDDALRARMGAAGPANIAKFDWSRTADETLHVYRTAKTCNDEARADDNPTGNTRTDSDESESIRRRHSA